MLYDEKRWMEPCYQSVDLSPQHGRLAAGFLVAPKILGPAGQYLTANIETGYPRPSS
ncbi:MAG: hypothetical protein PHC53_03130 [Patescibacteria group bacterium]|nr:hypothetical protein [Patescibacteria group bacterium]